MAAKKSKAEAVSPEEAARRRKRKAPPHAWKPGQSGNPKGRKPLPTDYKTFLNDRLGPMGLAALESILDNKDHPRHEQAVEYTINRWKGTPTVKVETSGPAGGPIEIRSVKDLSSGERRKAIAAAMVKRAALEAELSAADDGKAGPTK